MNELLPFVVAGLATGALYGLAGLGLVLTYRTSGVFNFGHGAIAAGAAYLFYTAHVTYHWPWALAALATIFVFATVVAFLLEVVTRGLGEVPDAIVVVATLGILLGVEGLLFLRYGVVTRHFPQFLPTSGITVSDVNVSWAQIISFGIATSGAIVLYVFLRRSRLGVAMRAVVDNPTLLSLTGQRTRGVRVAAWSIGCAFAAMSGILLAPTLGLDPNLLTFLVVQAFGAAAIGLFKSLPLTYVGGFVIGVAASVATKYFTTQPLSGLPPTMPFLILIVVLLVVPVSKLPRRRVSARNLVPESTPLSGRANLMLWAVLGGGLLLVPTVVGTHLPVWIAGLSYAALFGSLALLVWVSGQISACHMAFAALGATSMAHFAPHMPWLVALVLAGLLTVPIGAVVAIPAIRLSGIYLALVTLGFGIFMQNVMFPTSLMFGAQLTVRASRPQLGFIDGTSDRWMYYITLAIVGVVLAILAAIYRGQMGQLLRAMSETPTMLSTHGLGVSTTRLIVFCTSAFFAGVSGALLLTQSGAASGVGFGPLQSLLLLAVLTICGTRLLRSSMLAAALIAVMPGYLTGFGAEKQIFAFGLVAIIAALIISRRAELTAWFGQAAASVADRRGRGPALERLDRCRAGVVAGRAGAMVSAGTGVEQ